MRISHLGLAIVVATSVSAHAAAPISEAACEARSNDTPAKLAECIREPALWHQLSAFQRIADENPIAGHANRATGHPGYKASVAHVAALVRAAGYRVTIQPYNYTKFEITDTPTLASARQTYKLGQDWFVARLSGAGTLTAPVQPAGPRSDNTGCAPGDFASFVPGNIALVQRGDCDADDAVANAEHAGAAAVVIYNFSATAHADGKYRHGDGSAFETHLSQLATIPVAGTVSNAVGTDLYRQYQAGAAPELHLDIRTRHKSDIDYNLIADSPFGDPKHVVILEGHLDAIYGAGMLDNASGSTTILEIALNMANTPTRNQLRYIWFGGEELGLLGSKYYTRNLTKAELKRIVFDIDADVTATPNFAVLVADPRFAPNVKRFPPNVVPDSKVGNQDFADYFRAVGIGSRPGAGGNTGTDSNSFSLVGVPNTGVLTQQDCCKHQWDVRLWGGFLGNYEGKIPSYNGGCVDQPHRWCDNLDNNDPAIFEIVSKAVAYVTSELANDESIDHNGP